MSSKQRAKNWPTPRHTEFVKTLRKASGKWFNEKNFKVHSKMPYCLDDYENWSKNIILEEVADYIKMRKSVAESSQEPYPLHKYIHHGLSSQAMLFNLTGPLITRNDLSVLSQLFKQKGIPTNFDGAKYEFADRTVFNEDTGQPTSIDLVLTEGNTPCVFIESKFVETEFGGCSVFADGDCAGENPVNKLGNCFLHFIGRKYLDKLEQHNFTDKLKNEMLCPLINHYQFFREILFSIDKQGYFVLLYDERSTVFNYTVNNAPIGLMPLLMQFIPEEHKSKIAMITVQEVVEAIKDSGRHNDWIEEFELKYGLIKPVVTTLN